MATYGGYSTKSDTRKYLEGIIPIIILVLIGVVIAAKMGWISGIPFLGDMFGGGSVQIAVIGQLSGGNTEVSAQYLEDYFNSPEAQSYEFQEVEFDPETAKYSGEKLLNQFDMVILAGERNFSRPVKEGIGNYIKGGGKLVVIGDAAINDPNDPLVLGWNVDEMAGTFPVALEYDLSKEDIDEPKTLIGDLTFSFTTIDHPIYENTGYPMESNFSDLEGVHKECSEHLHVIPIMPQGGDILGVIEGEIDGEEGSKTILAIAEKKTSFGGHVAYFSYDPGCTRGLWTSTVNYMVGR